MAIVVQPSSQKKKHYPCLSSDRGNSTKSPGLEAVPTFRNAYTMKEHVSTFYVLWIFLGLS